MPRDLIGPLTGLRLFIRVNSRLALTVNTNGGLNIGWPDIWTRQLLWSPTLRPGVVWNPAGGTPAHVGGFYEVTVTPGAEAAAYDLGP